ncbi:glucose-1-phosphate thymidylyltransferase [Caldinitratiruptor microaerophilus]|uniref:Glucose-1-phosphate thymidylyltransferase n=1 Tax=Caldinitratiruptor microaerophilus TaxID=671077 RepID=A0AA35G5L9_9FIRM|nr:glucose-1-phosphate thymidylyltransferase [Caldinitratiruptor microaerophilus]BDG59686.1 glucose-1-phosphate thymidylyltransferase [Caldinitratiruptor microaerophilus]
MKALLLSGGTGSRLRPLTYTCPKQLIPVANKPVLYRALEAIGAGGIADVAVVVGEAAPAVMASVGDGSRWGLRVTYLRQDAPRGLAHAVAIAEEFLAADPFVLFLGDTLLKDGIGAAVTRFQATRPDALVVVGRAEDPGRFGVVEVKGGRVHRLEEKPRTPRSDLVLVGVYVFGPRVFDAVRAIRPSARGELEITDAIQQMADWGCTVDAHQVAGWWKDIGTPEDLLDANRLLLEDVETELRGLAEESWIAGPVRLGAGTVVRRSTVRGPAVIGEGCHIEDAHVGPFTSVGDRCTLRRVQIENSIVLEGCVLDRVAFPVVSSVLGRETVIGCGGTPSRGLGLVVGDRSRICPV